MYEFCRILETYEKDYKQYILCFEAIVKTNRVLQEPHSTEVLRDALDKTYMICHYNAIITDVIMPYIMPITELRKTNEISELCHRTQEPVFITKNGYGDLVVMSLETYEKKTANNMFYDSLAIAQNELENGEVSNSQTVFENLRKKHGYQV